MLTILNDYFIFGEPKLQALLPRFPPLNSLRNYFVLDIVIALLIYIQIYYLFIMYTLIKSYYVTEL